MNIEKPTFKHICYMHLQQLTNFPYIEKDFDALTDYELLCKVVDYLNEVIKNNNEQNTVVTNLYNAFVELKDYVDNFFDNLDVQEEINNKLDEMAEDGTLDQIIEQYLSSSALWGFDTVDDMQNATNLINGSYARTLGYYSVNDGGGALYKITDTASLTEHQEELANDLYATLIINNFLNVKQIGAKGDGINNDTNKIIEAINLSKNVYIPSGNYLINEELELQNSSLLFGDGYDSVITSSASNVISYDETSQIIMPQIHDLKIVGNGNNTCLNLVRTDSSISLVRGLFYNLYIYNFETGLHSRYIWTNKFTNVSFHNTPRPLNLESQSNAIDFDTCTFTGTNDTSSSLCSTLVRCQTINFNNCNIASKHYFVFRNLCEITFNDCYIEEVYQDKFFSSGTGNEQGCYITINHCHGYKETPLEIYLYNDSNNELIINSLFNQFVIATQTVSNQKIVHNYLSKPTIKNLISAANTNLISTEANLYLNEIDNQITANTNSRHFIYNLGTSIPANSICRMEMLYALTEHQSTSYLQFLDSSDNVLKQALIPFTAGKLTKGVLEFVNGDVAITKIKISNANSSYNSFNFNNIIICNNGDIEPIKNEISQIVYTSSIPTYTPQSIKMVVNNSTQDLYMYDGTEWQTK